MRAGQLAPSGHQWVSLTAVPLTDYDAKDGSFPASKKTVNGARRAFEIKGLAILMHTYDLPVPAGCKPLVLGEKCAHENQWYQLVEQVADVMEELAEPLDYTSPK